MYGLAIFFILTDSRAVAGRFLKVVWKLLKTLHYVYYLFVTLPVPNLALLWPSFVCYASPFVPYLCVYYHTVYWFMDSTGASRM